MDAVPIIVEPIITEPNEAGQIIQQHPIVLPKAGSSSLLFSVLLAVLLTFVVYKIIDKIREI